MNQGVPSSANAMSIDLVIELQKKGKKRFGKVAKTRLEQFPDDDTFEWSYEAIRKRYGADMLEKEASVVKLAAPEQVAQLKDLLAVVRLPEGTTDKWLAKAGVDVWEDMSADTIAKCIDYVKSRFPAAAAHSVECRSAAAASVTARSSAASLICRSSASPADFSAALCTASCA